MISTKHNITNDGEKPKPNLGIIDEIDSLRDKNLSCWLAEDNANYRVIHPNCGKVLTYILVMGHTT